MKRHDIEKENLNKERKKENMKKLLIIGVLLSAGLFAQTPPYPFNPLTFAGTSAPLICSNGSLFFNTTTFIWYTCGPNNSWNILNSNNPSSLVTFQQIHGILTTVQQVLRTSARITDYGVSVNSSQDQTALFTLAEANAIADGHLGFIIPSGTYHISNWQITSGPFMIQCEDGATFVASADGAPIIKFTTNNNSPEGYMNCNFDLGQFSHGFTNTDGVYLDTVVGPLISGNSYIGIPPNHAGLKFGGILYGSIGPDKYSGGGRCWDGQQSYSSQMGVSYGANVTQFIGARSTCSGSQGFRMSGTFKGTNLDWEGTLSNDTTNAIDFSDPNAITYANIDGIYIEGTATTSGQRAMYVDGGGISMSSHQIIFSDGIGSASTCLYLDSNIHSLFYVDVHGGIFRGCDTASFHNAKPINSGSYPGSSGFRGGYNFVGNAYYTNATHGCSFGTGVLSNFTAGGLTQSHLDCPELGTLSAFGFGIITGGPTFSVSGCSANTLLGGASAGSFVSGSSATCTFTITMGGSTGLQTMNGWVCSAYDVTASTNLTQSGGNTTVCLVTGAVTSGDLIKFLAVGY